MNMLNIVRAALTWQLAALLLLTAANLLLYCTTAAQEKNHPKAKKAARIGGWLYTVLATAIIISNIL